MTSIKQVLRWGSTRAVKPQHTQLLRYLKTASSSQSLVKDDAQTQQLKQHERQRFELERELQWTESANWNSYQYDPMHERAKLAEILVHSGFSEWQKYTSSNNPFINKNASDAQFNSILRHRSKGTMLTDVVPGAPAAGHANNDLKSSDGHNGINFHVGQVVYHKRYEYKGVIVGWDPACYQSFEWILAMHHIQRKELIDPMSFISIQATPHYHVLVDTRYRGNNQITYCMQSNLELTETPEKIRHNLLDHYFVEYDEEKMIYVPHKQLACLYPDDLSCDPGDN